MPVVVSLLRAVNLAGYRTIKMDALRDLYASLGLRDARTYVQSGNVVFRTGDRDLAALAARIEKAMERRFGFRAEVVNRTAGELKSLIARNPFADRAGIEPAKLIVSFLAADPDPGARERIAALKPGPEELRLDGRELFIYYANGIGRSKLTTSLLDRILKTTATGRNWNTVGKLREMAEEMEAAEG